MNFSTLNVASSSNQVVIVGYAHNSPLGGLISASIGVAVSVRVVFSLPQLEAAPRLLTIFI